MTSENITFRCADGVRLSGHFFSANGHGQGKVVIAPALGIPQAFYRTMAEFLAANGFHALTFDYRGVGESASPGLQGSKIRLDQWGARDMDAVFSHAHQMPGGKLFLMGHSAGGQLFGMAPNSEHLDGLVMVSSLIPWWRSFPRPWNLRVWVLMHLVMPLFSLGRDYFPARKLRISAVDVPSGVTRQWSRWGRCPDYFFDNRWGFDLHRYATFDFPVLVCRIDDDDYAPWKAICRLLEHLPATRREIWHVESRLSDTGAIGHVNFFRESMQGIYWDRIVAWLCGQSANPGKETMLDSETLAGETTQ